MPELTHLVYPICKVGNVIVVGNHYDGLAKLCAGALDKPQHLCAGLAVKVAGRLVGQYDSRFGNCLLYTSPSPRDTR